MLVCPAEGPTVVPVVPFGVGSPGLDVPVPAAVGEFPLPIGVVPALQDLSPFPFNEAPEVAGGEMVNGTTVAGAGGCGDNTVPLPCATSTLATAAATAARRALKNCSSAKFALLAKL